MNRKRSTAPQPHRCVRLQISEGPATRFQLHLRAAAPLHCRAFCSHCSPSGPEKLWLQSKQGFERLTGQGARGLGAVVVAWDPTWPSASNDLVNPGDPALRPARALCLRVRPVEGGAPPVPPHPGCGGGPALSACCFFPQRGSGYKEELEMSLHTSRDMAALQRPQGKD